MVVPRWWCWWWQLLLLLLLLLSLPSGVKIPRVKSKVKSKTKSWSGHSSLLEKLLWSKMELKCWIVIEMRWKRKLSSQLSPEIDAILRPSSEKKAIDDYCYYYVSAMKMQTTCCYQHKNMHSNLLSGTKHNQMETLTHYAEWSQFALVYFWLFLFLSSISYIATHPQA